MEKKKERREKKWTISIGRCVRSNTPGCGFQSTGLIIREEIEEGDSQCRFHSQEDLIKQANAFVKKGVFVMVRPDFNDLKEPCVDCGGKGRVTTKHNDGKMEMERNCKKCLGKGHMIVGFRDWRSFDGEDLKECKFQVPGWSNPDVDFDEVQEVDEDFNYEGMKAFIASVEKEHGPITQESAAEAIAILGNAISNPDVLSENARPSFCDIPFASDSRVDAGEGWPEGSHFHREGEQTKEEMIQEQEASDRQRQLVASDPSVAMPDAEREKMQKSFFDPNAKANIEGFIREGRADFKSLDGSRRADKAFSAGWILRRNGAHVGDCIEEEKAIGFVKG